MVLSIVAAGLAPGAAVAGSFHSEGTTPVDATSATSAVLQQQTVTDPTDENFDACYVYSSRQNQETLQLVDKNDATTTDIGPGGTGEDVTDMAFQPGTGTLFAVENSVQLGTLSLTDGTFTPIGGTGFGTARGSLGAIEIDSVDGLTFDPTDGTLYAIHERSQSLDLLVKVNPATGNVVQNGFGTNVEYVIIDRIGTGNDNVDGLAVDPDDGQMYAVGNDPGANDNLVAIDKTTGVATDVGELGVNNIEGLTFDLNGDAYAVTTSAGGAPDGEAFYSVSTTGPEPLAERIGALDGKKYLAVACGLGGPGQQSADLSVNKTANLTTVAQDENVEFTVSVTNDGPDPTTGVVVSDVLPAGLTYVSDAPSKGIYDTGSGNWTVGDLANGETATLTLVANATGDVGTQQENIAQVAASDVEDPDSTPGDDARGADDLDTAVVTIAEPNQADVSIAKTVSDTTPAPGDTITYTITATNGGPRAANVTVQEGLPTDLTIQSVDPGPGSYDGSSQQWTVTVAPETSATLTVTATVGSNVAGETTITNVAEVIDSNQTDPDSTPGNNVPGEDDQDNETITVTAADLAVTKTVDSSAVAPGDQVTFTVNVTNAGPSIASGVTVSDQLPAGLTYESHTTTLGAYNETTGIWELPDLGPGETETLTITATASQVGEFTNVAAINTSDQFDPEPGNNEGSSTVTVSELEADLSVTKAVDDPTPRRGDTINFTLSVQNLGPDPASGVELSDQLPAGITYLSSTGDGTYDPNTGIWTVGDVPVEATRSITITARVDTDEPVVNTVLVSDRNEDDPNLENNSDSVLVTPEGNADVSVNKTVNVSSDVSNGTDVQFTVNVTNDGPSDADLEVNDSLPAGFVFLSANESQGTYDETTGVWDVGVVPNGSTATLLIDARVNLPDGGVLNNVAQVAESDKSDPDSQPGNNVFEEDDLDDASVTVTPETPGSVDLELNKTVTDTGVGTCRGTSYTITVTNNASVGTDATGVTVSDDLPAGVSVTSASPDQGSFDPVTGVWSVGTLAPGDSATLTIEVRIDGEVGTTQNNIAQVATVDQVDVDSTPGNDLPTEDDQDGAALTVQAGLTGFISGRVSDPDNNDVPNAIVVVRDADSGEIVATTFTDADGEYTVEVTPGAYDLTVDKPGFTTVAEDDVTVECDKTTSLNLVIEPRRVAETIRVTPEEATTQVGTTITYTVTVEDGDGQPLPNVDVEAVLSNPADVRFQGLSIRPTNAQGQTTFTITADVVAETSITFTALSGSNPSTNATGAFVQRGGGSIQGTILDDATTDPVEDASVWAVLQSTFQRNTRTTTVNVSNGTGSGADLVVDDPDGVVYFRLVDNETGEILDNGEYRVQTPNSSDTAIRPLSALNTSNASVGEGFAVLDLDRNGSVRFQHTRLEPREYYVQYSLTAPNNSDVDEFGDASNPPENFTNVSVGGTGPTVFDPPADLTLAATQQRAETSGANFVDSPGFVNSYGEDTSGTDENGYFKLTRLFANFQVGVNYTVIATKTGYSVEFGEVFVTEDGREFTDSPFQGLNLEPRAIEPGEVNVTQIGIHPPVSQTNGTPDFSAIRTFDDQSDDVFQEVPRDGDSIDVVKVETTTDRGANVNATVEFTVNDALDSSDGNYTDGGDFQGTYLGVVDDFTTGGDGGALLSTSNDGDTATLATGEDGVAFLLIETDQDTSDLRTRKDAVLTNDRSATDESNVTFVGVNSFRPASLSGILTDNRDVRVENTFVYVRNIRWGGVDDDDDLLTIRPDGGEGGDAVDDPTDTFTITHYADDGVDAGPADEPGVADPIPSEMVGQDTGVNRSELGTYTFSAVDFPSIDASQPFKLAERSGADDSEFTLKDVPAVPPSTGQPTTFYDVRGVALSTTQFGALGNATGATKPGFTDDANIAFPFEAETAFTVSDLQAPEQASEGAAFEVSANVSNAGSASGDVSAQFRVDLDQDGVLEEDETLLTQSVQDVGAGEAVPVTFDVPAGTTAGLNGTFGHGVVLIDPITGEVSDSVTADINITNGSSGGVVVGDNPNPSQDLDGDGFHEDVDGDGDFDIADVQTFFAELNSDAVQENPDLFNFNEDPNGDVNINDVQALFFASQSA